MAAAELPEEPAKSQRGILNRAFQLNRRVFKAYLLKENLEKLWDCRYEGAMLLKHLEGILNYCRTRVRFGVVEAINGNIRMLISRGYKNMRDLLLKAKRIAVTNTEYVAFHKTRKAA
jgi:transposase